jgi:hypothetical protein
MGGGSARGEEGSPSASPTNQVNLCTQRIVLMAAEYVNCRKKESFTCSILQAFNDSNDLKRIKTQNGPKLALRPKKGLQKSYNPS